MVLQIGISKISKKNSKDGLFFYFNNRKKINIDQYIGTGDVAIFNPIIPHEVKPSKIGSGRWSLLVSSGYFGGSKGTKLQSRQLN